MRAGRSTELRLDVVSVNTNFLRVADRGEAVCAAARGQPRRRPRRRRARTLTARGDAYVCAHAVNDETVRARALAARGKFALRRVPRLTGDGPRRE